MPDVVIRKYRDRTSVGLVTGPGRTKQSMADECDVNKLMAKYEKTGQLTHVSGRIPSYGDFSNVDDYKSAVDQIKEAETAFATLSARVRERMGNDPGNLLAFLADPDNLEEAVELGLVEHTPDEDPAIPVPTPPTPEEKPKATGGESTPD